MATLILIMFMMGLLALVCHLFNVFAWLMPWWALGNMALAYYMFTLIWKKEQEGEKEKLVDRIVELEARVE
jgi:4-hydroxybenzoate polyprenyltransferase